MCALFSKLQDKTELSFNRIESLMYHDLKDYVTFQLFQNKIDLIKKRMIRLDDIAYFINMQRNVIRNDYGLVQGEMMLFKYET